jgi:hypothetical protein
MVLDKGYDNTTMLFFFFFFFVAKFLWVQLCILGGYIKEEHKIYEKESLLRELQYYGVTPDVNVNKNRNYQRQPTTQPIPNVATVSMVRDPRPIQLRHCRLMK